MAFVAADRPLGRDVHEPGVVRPVLADLEADPPLPVVVRVHLGVVGERDGQVVDAFEQRQAGDRRGRRVPGRRAGRSSGRSGGCSIPRPASPVEVSMRTPTTTSCSGACAVSSTRIVTGSSVVSTDLRLPVAVEQLDVDDLTLAAPPAGALLALDPPGLVALALVRRDDVGRRPDLPQLALVDPGGVLAELLDLAEPVADEHDRAPVPAELVDLLGAPALEALVADREHLVDQQHLGLDVGGDGEAEAHVHARRVVLHRRVDELLEPGERRRCRRSGP